MILALVSVLSTISLLVPPSITSSADRDTTSDDPIFVDSTTPASDQMRLRLFQFNPVEKNHVQDFTFQSGHVIHLKTLAKEPPLFEIPGFLSAEECDHIKQLALESGLFKSTLKKDREDEDTDEQESCREVFRDIDTNKDEVLDVEEVLETLDVGINAFLRPEDALNMIHDLHLDPNGDGVLSFAEFSNIDRGKMNEIKEWTERHSKDESRLNRVSQQAWLSQDDGDDKVLTDLRQRTSELTGLPQGIVEHSEKLQVVYYEPGGHFHSHYDSEEINSNQQCSHTIGLLPQDDSSHGDERATRLCRFITILYYLDDTEEGGETAFPIADNETFSEEDLSVNTHDLSRHCHDANLYVKPEKGKAVMWYNHYINKTTGWLGPMNPYSLHGGCDVRQGTKWIANNWITVDDSLHRQMLYMQAMRLRNDIGDANHGFYQAVDNLRGIWMAYVQSSTGWEAAQNFFDGEIHPEDVVDVLADYTVANAAEIQVTHGVGVEGTYAYNIVWHRELDQTQVHRHHHHHHHHHHEEEAGAAEMSSFILMACTHGGTADTDHQRQGPLTVKEATPHVLKNPRLTAGSGGGKDVGRYPGNGRDGRFEKRTVDEL